MHQWPPRHPRAVCNPMPNPGRVRTSAAAPLPSASRALRSFASLARSCSPRACAHRPTRLAAGWSSTTSPLPPTPSTTACALPPSLTSALAGRALAAALAALHRVLVDAAATADLIARAAAAAALAAAAPALAAPFAAASAAVPVRGRVSFRVSSACTLPVLLV